MVTITRLSANGLFQTSVALDEVTQTKISQSPTNIFASEFDEVTINPVRKLVKDLTKKYF